MTAEVHVPSQRCFGRCHLWVSPPFASDGIVVEERRGLGGHRFADAELIESIHERGVRLSATADEARALPAPSANPAVMRDDPAAPADTAASGLEDKLKRAWDLISGRGLTKASGDPSV